MISTHRFAATVVATVVFVLLALEVLTRLAAPVLPDPVRWYSRYADVRAALLAEMDDEGVTPDVVFVGDSSTGSALDPEVFATASGCDLTAFSAVLPGSGPPSWRRWLDDVVLAHVEPSMVVIGLTTRPMNLNNSVAATGLDDYLKSDGARHDVGIRAWRRVEQVSAFARYRTIVNDPEQWRNVAGTVVPMLELDQPWDKIDADGFDRTSSLGRPYRLGEFASAGEGLLRNFTVSNEQVQELVDIQSTLRAADVDVVVVMLPLGQDWIDQHPRGALDVRSLTEDLHDAGLSVVDLAADITLTREELNDPIHANQDGAQRVSTALAAAVGPRVCNEVP